jgi:hypothetical protein
MTALSAAERAQHHDLLHELVTSIRAQRELTDGFEFTLDRAVKLRDAGAWIALERRCCPFLRFVLDVPPEGEITLALRGPDGVKEFLVAELRLG